MARKLATIFATVFLAGSSQEQTTVQLIAILFILGVAYSVLVRADLKLIPHP